MPAMPLRVHSVAAMGRAYEMPDEHTSRAYNAFSNTCELRW